MTRPFDDLADDRLDVAELRRLANRAERGWGETRERLRDAQHRINQLEADLKLYGEEHVADRQLIAELQAQIADLTEPLPPSCGVCGYVYNPDDTHHVCRNPPVEPPPVCIPRDTDYGR
jgi:hypothetical protein